MEEPWSKICIKWVGLLKLAPCSDILSLTDGKFFLSFMKEYLNLDRECFTISETFGAIGSTLRNEFPFPDLVKLSDAQQGHEEELVKVITLFMYLAVVKYEHFGPKNYLHDDAHFSEEAKFRMKCILKALLEQHGVLTPALLTEIIGSKISDMTATLSAPVQKLRATSRPSMGSPVIFASSPGHESPLKEFLDSPTVRQVTKYQRLMEERNTHNRELRAALETEKMEKQFAAEELERLRKAKEAADMEVMALKQERRERAAASDLDMSRNSSNAELSEKFHSLLEEKKDSDKYLALIEKQLEEQLVEKEQMRGRMEVLAGKLATVQDEKHRVDIAFMEMQANLGSTKVENGNLQENMAELRQQLDDLSQQLMVKSMPKKGVMASFHLETMDMTNVSVDANDSCDMPLEGSGGENMMDVVERKLEEKIEMLGLELDTEKEARACDREAGDARIAEVEAEVKAKEEMLEARNGEIVQLEEKVKVAGEDNKVLKENVATLQGEMEAVRVKLENTANELNKNVGENNRLNEELKNYQESKQQLENRVEVMEESNTALRTELAGEKEVNEDLKKSVEVEKQTVAQKQSEIQSLGQNISTLSGQLGEAVEKESSLVKTLEEKGNNIEQLLMEKNKIIEEKQAMRSEFENRIAKSTVDIDGLKVDISQKQTELERTQGELEEFRTGFSELGEKIKTTTAQVDGLEADLSRVTGENNELRENLVKCSETNHEMEELIKNKSSEISSLQQKCEAYVSEMEAVKAKKDEVTKAVEFFEKELSQLQVQSQQSIESNQKKVADLEETKETMTREIKDLNENVTAYANQLKEVSEKEKEANKALEESLKNVADIEKKCEQQKIDIETMTEQNLAKITSLEKELQSCKDTIVEMTERCKEHHIEVIAQMKVKLTETETKMLDLEKEQENVVLQNEERISQLTCELNETKLSLEEKSNQIFSVNEELNAKKEEVRNLNEKYNLVSKQFKEERASLEKSSQSMETLKEETYDLSKTVKSLKEEIATLKEAAQCSEDKLALAVKENEEVAKNLASVTAEKNNFESQNATLKDTVQQLEELSKKNATQIESMSREIETQNDSIVKLNNLVQDTNSGKSSIEQELMDLKRQKIEFETIVQNKTQENESLQKEIEVKRVENVQINESLVAMKKEKEVIVAKNSEEIREIQNTLEKIELERQDLSMEKQQMTNTIQDINSKVESTDSLVESLQQEKDSLASRCSDLEDERTANIARIADIEKDVERLEEEKRHAETDKHRMEFIQSQMDELGNTNEELKEQLNKADNETKGYKNKNCELVKELDFVKKDMENKLSESAALVEKVEEMKKRKEEIETINSKLTVEVENVSKEKQALQSEQEKQKEALAEVEKLLNESKAKTTELEVKVDQLEKVKCINEEKLAELETQVETSKVENVKISEHSRDIQKLLEVEKMQGSVAHSHTEEVKAKIEEITEEKRITEEANTELKRQVKEAKEELEKISSQSNNTNNLLEAEKQHGQESKAKVEELSSNLEKMSREKSVLDKKLSEKDTKLRETSKMKEDLAASVSQLLTDTNQLKADLKNYENEKSTFVSENQSLMEQNKILNDKISQLELKLNQLTQEKETIDKDSHSKVKTLQSELEDTKQELAREQIKYTDLEQATQSSADQDTKTALKAQKERYEKKHQEIVKQVMEKNVKKMEELKNMCFEKTESLEQSIKTLEEEKNILLDKYEESKQKANSMMEKVAKMEAANEEELGVVRQKYNAAKDVIRRFKEENDAVNEELRTSKARIEELASKSEAETYKRELVTVKTENRRLTTQLSVADTRLREANSLERRNTLDSKTSLSSDASSSSTARPSRQAWKTAVEEQPTASKTRAAKSSTSSTGDDKTRGSRLPARNSVNSSRQSYSSLPGRKSTGRQSLSSLPESEEGDNDVFKMPSAAHTPGRTKTGRTVSDSKMTGFKLRPPSGAGSLFHCDEEEGEMFSSSYLTDKSASNETFSSSFLTDMKAGRCDVTGGDGRMSELARRNTLCLPHLKSSYPVESQFLEDEDVTEEDIRQSKVKLLRGASLQPTDFPYNERHEFQSPVSNLSHKTEELSLDSPCRNTRLSRMSINHPGNSHRRCAAQGLTKSTSALGRLSTSNGEPKPGRAKRQSDPDPSEPPTKKEATNDTRIPLPPGKKPTSWSIPPPKSSKAAKQPPKPKMPDLLSPAPDNSRKRKSEERELKPPSELDSSQESQNSFFGRDSLRGSKRCKREGEVSYHKPGPPTPGRNKSHDNSLESLGSIDSAATTASAPADTSVKATPNASKLSTRSTRSHDRTPLLNTTNTPPMSRSVRSRLTPQGIKKVLGSAFRKAGKTRTYKLMSSKKGEDALSSTKTTPMKAKDKESRTPTRRTRIT